MVFMSAEKFCDMNNFYMKCTWTKITRITVSYLSGAHETCQLAAVPLSRQIGPSTFSPPAKATGNTDALLVFLIYK